MISKDIEELVREKLALETDIAQKEADIKIKSGEIKSLQVSQTTNYNFLSEPWCVIQVNLLLLS